MKTRYKILMAFATVILVLAGSFVALTGATDPPASCSFHVDLARARALTQSLPGSKPTQVRVEHTNTFRFPGRAVRGGASWGMVEMPVYAYELVFPDRTIVMDAAMSPEQANDAHSSDYDAAAWPRLQQALGAASAIYVTHEHGDHLGGLFAGSLSPRVHLTPKQMASPERSKPVVISDAAKKAIQPLVYEGMVALAPGVVAIEAPGHTPGSQWFLVTREDGAELLFIGDTAWHMSNIENVQGPPKLASMMLKNDREANACQLAELKATLAREPKLQVVPGHDGARMKDLLASGALQQGF